MRLRSTLAVLALLLAGALFLPRGYAEPEPGFSLAARVPSTAIGYVALEDLGSWEARFEQTAIHKLFAHPEMQAFLKPMTGAVQQMMEGRGPLQDAPPPVQELIRQLQNLHGDISLAVLDIDQSTGVPTMVASLDFGQHAAKFGEFLQGFRAEVDPEGQHIIESMVNGRLQWSVDADGMPITATIFDSAFVVSNSGDALTAVVEGEVESPLAASAGYARIHTRAGGDDVALFLYANMKPITEMLRRSMGEEGLAMASALGMDEIRSVGFGIAFAGDGFRDTFMVDAPNGKKGILGLLRYEPVTPEALRWVPGNAFYYQEGKANLDQYLANIKKLMVSIEPNAVDEIDKGVQHLNSMFGMDLEKDLLHQLDGHTAAYASMPSTGGLYPELVIMLKAKDGAVFETNMKKLADAIAGVLTEEGDALANTRTISYRDHTLHLMDLEGPRRRDMVPFTPTWARVADNWFAITLVPHTMKELILRQSTTGVPGLADQEDFQSVMAHAPRDTGSVAYLDLQGILTMLYDTGVPLLQTVAKPNVLPREFPPMDFALLPPTREIRPFLRSAGLFFTWDDNGIAFSSHGPIPMATIFVAAVAVAAIAPAAMMRTKRGDRVASRRMERPDKPGRFDQVQKDVAVMQARDLARHIRSYVLEHAKMPSSLQELVEKGMVGAVPADPWGNAFSLVVTNAAEKRFKVLSAGPDGKKGTKDDILFDG